MTDHIQSEISHKIDELIDLYETHGHQHYGEGVTQLQHALQSAELAIKEQKSDEMIIAAFLHDVGHLLSDRLADNDKTQYGSVKHEYNGSHYLEELGFSRYVIDMVENHVLAKRYLVSSKPGYYDTLSEASKKTFEYQGNILTLDECSEFEANPNFEDYITLRKYDDEAKENRVSMIKLEFMRELLIIHLIDNLT